VCILLHTSNSYSLAASVLLTSANGETRFGFGAAAKKHKDNFYNEVGFIPVMPIGDGALFEYRSLEDVRKQEVPVGKDKVIFRFRDSALDRPILRECTQTGGVTDKSMPKSSFTGIFRSTPTNARYFYGMSIPVIRRQLGKGADSNFILLVGMVYLDVGEFWRVYQVC
jgi:hypothetical protein